MRLASILWLAVGACLVPERLFALPILNEVFYDAEGSDRESAFTEILGEPGFRFDGFHLVGINGSNSKPYRTVALFGAVIPKDGLLVVATSFALGEVLAHRDFVANVDWQNGPDAVQLWDPDKRVIDALQYGNAGRHNAGEGAPASDPAAGFALTRDFMGTDTDDNESDFLAGRPTPGSSPVVIPAPSAFVLIGPGLLLSILCRAASRAAARARSCLPETRTGADAR